MEEIGKAISVLSQGLSSLAQGIDMITKQVGKLTAEQEKVKTKATFVQKPSVRITTTKKASANKKDSGNVAAKKSVDQKISAKKVSKVKKTETDKTNFDTVFELIQNSNDNITNAFIVEKTGFRRKQVADILFKLKKQHKIKNISRGIYTPI
jgi:uncharacterized protein YprB with RNaseH-like and TPR domain